MARTRTKTPPPAPDPTWSARVDQFVAHLLDEERSAHTINNYRDDLALFARWYRDHRDGEEPELGSLAKRDVVEFKQHIDARGGRDGREAAPATTNRKLAAVNALLRWAQARELAPRFDPPRPRKQQDRPQPRWLDKAEQRALVKAVESSRGPHRRRDFAIILLGLHTGLRVSEMASLKYSDIVITPRAGHVTVRRGKGDKPRVVPLNAEVRDALTDMGWDRHQRHDRPLFEGQRGGLKVRAIQDIVEKYADKARVGERRDDDGRPVGKLVPIKNCSAHTLRHTFGRRLVEAGVPISDIAALMGHSDPKTTLGYINPKHKDLADAVERIAGDKGDDRRDDRRGDRRGDRR